MSMNIPIYGNNIPTRSVSESHLAFHWTGVTQKMTHEQDHDRKSECKTGQNKGVSFGFVSLHKIFKGLDPEGSVEYLTRATLAQSLTNIWLSLEEYEAEKQNSTQK